MHSLEEIHAALKQLTVEQRITLGLRLRELDGIPSLGNQVREDQPAHASLEPSFMTLEEYFELEETTPLRHEFINGAVFAMAAPSLNHNRIASNLLLAIHPHVKRAGCQVFWSGLKVVIRQDLNEISYCPDVMVDCRPDARGAHYLREPKLIAEVMSPSTQLIDRREKLQNYRLIESLEEYVLLAENERHVIVYSRAEDWKPRVYSRLDAAVELRSIDMQLPMIELYDDVGRPD